MIPTHEIDLLTNTADLAAGLAHSDPGEGLTELEYGLERARVLRDAGDEGAEELVPRWGNAIDAFCEHFSR